MPRTRRQTQRVQRTQRTRKGRKSFRRISRRTARHRRKSVKRSRRRRKVGGAQTSSLFIVKDNRGIVKYLQVDYSGIPKVNVFSKESDSSPEKTMSFLIPEPQIVQNKLVSDHFILNGLTITMKPTDYKGRQPKEHDYEFESINDVNSFVIEISKAYVPIKMSGIMPAAAVAAPTPSLKEGVKPKSDSKKTAQPLKGGPLFPGAKLRKGGPLFPGAKPLEYSTPPTE